MREVDENVAGLTGLAESLATSTDNTVWGQLRAIEATMADDFVLDSDAPAGGLQRILIDRFLRDTRRGNTEQFVTAFVLLARSLGVDARVATGFVVEPPPDDDRLDISSSDAVIWPEVMLTDGTWVAFDPVPDAEAAESTPPAPEPEVQTPAAPQPPDAAPPDVDNESPDADTDPTDTSSTSLSEAAVWGIRVGAGVGVLVVPLLIGAGAILGAKYLRRRRRRTAEEASERIRGAWASATDGLVDAGLLIPPSSTDIEIAASGRGARTGSAARTPSSGRTQRCGDLRHADACRPARPGRRRVSDVDRRCDRHRAVTVATTPMAPQRTVVPFDHPLPGDGLTRRIVEIGQVASDVGGSRSTVVVVVVGGGGGSVAVIVMVATRDVAEPSLTV